MEAIFFIRSRLPGLEAAGRATAPSPDAGSPEPASATSHVTGHRLPELWEARRQGCHHSPRLLALERLVPAEGPAAPAQPC